jgi:hypothetical protein
MKCSAYPNRPLVPVRVYGQPVLLVRKLDVDVALLAASLALDDDGPNLVVQSTCQAADDALDQLVLKWPQ